MKAVSDFDQARQMTMLLQACAATQSPGDQKLAEQEVAPKVVPEDLDDWKERIRKLEALQEKKDPPQKVSKEVPAPPTTTPREDARPPPPPPLPEQKPPDAEVKADDAQPKKNPGQGLHRVGCFDVLDDDTLEIWARVVPGRKKRPQPDQAVPTPESSKDKKLDHSKEPGKCLRCP